MNKEIQPNYVECTISCACGNKVETKSIIKDIHVDICSNCHPFYTGGGKQIERGGRAEKFKSKYGL